MDWESVLGWVWKFTTGVVIPYLIMKYTKKYKDNSEWQELLKLFEAAWQHVEAWKVLKLVKDGRRPTSKESENEFIGEIETWKKIRKMKPMDEVQYKAAIEWAKIRSMGAKINEKRMNGRTPPEGIRIPVINK